MTINSEDSQLQSGGPSSTKRQYTVYTISYSHWLAQRESEVRANEKIHLHLFPKLDHHDR